MSTKTQRKKKLKDTIKNQSRTISSSKTLSQVILTLKNWDAVQLNLFGRKQKPSPDHLLGPHCKMYTPLINQNSIKKICQTDHTVKALVWNRRRLPGSSFKANTNYVHAFYCNMPSPVHLRG